MGATVQRQARNAVTSSQAYGELILHSSKGQAAARELYDEEAPRGDGATLHTRTYTHTHTHTEPYPTP